MVKLPTPMGNLRVFIRRFQEAFPKQYCGRFFRAISRHTGTTLSDEHKLKLINACLVLIDSKQGCDRNDVLQKRLSADRKIQSEAVQAIKDVKSACDDAIASLEKLEKYQDNYEGELADRFERPLFLMQEKLFGQSALMPMPTLRFLLQTASWSANETILSSKVKSPGPAPDTAVRGFIDKLADIFEDATGKKITSPWKPSEERRVSPFIDFVKEIHRALPDEAQMGLNGVYTDPALDDHVDQVRKRRARKG